MDLSRFAFKRERGEADPVAPKRNRLHLEPKRRVALLQISRERVRVLAQKAERLHVKVRRIHATPRIDLASDGGAIRQVGGKVRREVSHESQLKESAAVDEMRVPAVAIGRCEVSGN